MPQAAASVPLHLCRASGEAHLCTLYHLPNFSSAPPLPCPPPSRWILSLVVEGFGPFLLSSLSPPRPSLLPPASLGFSFDINL